MAWIVWLIIALVFGLVLIASVDFAFVMFAGGALIAALVSLFTDSWPIQIVVFCVVSVILLITVRPWANRKMANTSPERRTNADALRDQYAEALSDITERGGRVKLKGEVWSARTQHGPIPEGAACRVITIDGATAIVVPREG